MLKESFLGHNPSHFKINSIVKAYIISDSLLWSAWNFVTPIFAIFVVNNINGGSIENASFGFSLYLISRVIFELLAGKLLINSGADKRKMRMAIAGMLCLSASYLGFAFTSEVLYMYLFYIIAGMGLGIASPAKNALFSIHLDKSKEAAEWGISDAVTFAGMAAASTIGGIIAKSFGFQALFILAFFINLLATLPYLFFFNKDIQEYMNIPTT